MVYNLRSIGMSLMENAGDSNYTAKPDSNRKGNLKGSIKTASTSSLNNPTTELSFYPANQDLALITYPSQNTNQNHGSDTYVCLMSSFEEGRFSRHKKFRQSQQEGKMAFHDDSVINLDSSFEQTILDISNNSTPSDSNSPNNSVSTETDSKFVCTVLNCAVEFSSLSNLEDHMELFKHSPCNPCLLTKDCMLAGNPLCFICPECDLEFPTRNECTEHINRRKHLTFFPPLAITAYMCSQCLHLFGSLEECWTHIEKQSHHGISYPFANDHALTTNKAGAPVPVAKELVQDIISKCNQVAYRLQCLECGISVETPAILRHHQRETQNQHVIAALTETSLIDVFAKFLAGFSCNTCHRLFTGELKEMAKHQCARRVEGTITENDTCSFAEFVKRCALTVIKSIELEDVAGPSRNCRSSPICNERNNQKKGTAEELSTYCTQPNEASPVIEQTVVNDATNKTGVNSNYTESMSKGQRKTRWDVQPRNLYNENATESSKVSNSRNQFDDKRTLTVNLTDSEGMLKASKGPRKSRWDVETKTNSADVSDLKNCNEENKEKSVMKNAKSSEINNNENYILIEDTDDASDETDVDLTPNSGAKRKRMTKTVNTANKKCLSPKRGQDSGNRSILASPFIVINYKPRSPRLQGNVLTQGYAVQPSEKRSSPIDALSGCNKQELSKGKPVITSRYTLRARSADKSTTSDSQAKDVGFENIAERFLQEEVVQRSARSRHEIFLENLPGSKRDRSCSPVQSLDFGNTLHVISQGNVGQPYLNPVEGMNCIPTRPTFQPSMPGPTRYNLRNRCNFTATSQQYSQYLPPPNFPYRQPDAKQFECPSHQMPQMPFKNNQYFRPVVTLQQPTPLSDTSPSSCENNVPLTSATSSQPRVTARQSVERLIATEHLSMMKNIVFLDLDNWPSFFHKLPFCLPDFTFVWGFYGGKNPWYPPMRLEIFQQMRQKEQFYLNERCGTTKDAADFAIVLAVGKMDEKLPANIAFTIMSGDKGFCEVERQMRNSERKVMVVNPHLAARFSNDMIYALVTSVTDT